LTAARYTSLKVVSLPFTQHLIPRWSGCATAAYAKERKRKENILETFFGRSNDIAKIIGSCVVWVVSTSPFC